jgi:hypothetical protein
MKREKTSTSLGWQVVRGQFENAHSGKLTLIQFTRGRTFPQFFTWREFPHGLPDSGRQYTLEQEDSAKISTAV